MGQTEKIIAGLEPPALEGLTRAPFPRLADFCYEKGIVVISDEIHCDMAIFGNKHIPFASISDKAASCSITFGAPSKTFNIAGIVCSYAIVPDADLRKKFYGWMEANEFGAAPIFSPIATIAAFRKGEEWRKQMISFSRNYQLLSFKCFFQTE